MSPVSRQDAPLLSEIAEELHRIATILNEMGERAAKAEGGNDHAAALGGIQASLSSIASSLRGIAPGR